MAKAKKSAKSKSAAPRKRATHERALKNRPPDNEPPEQSEQEAPESTEDQELLPGAEGAKPKRTPRQKRLPGTEDPEIEELEAAAEAYAEVRDERMELTKQEVSTQAELLKLMKKYDKKTYVHDGYDLKLVAEKEKVRVRIKKDKD